jgi:hypothetical protein
VAEAREVAAAAKAVTAKVRISIGATETEADDMPRETKVVAEAESARVVVKMVAKEASGRAPTIGDAGVEMIGAAPREEVLVDL